MEIILKLQILLILSPIAVFAAPTKLTYQGKIVRQSDNTPLEASGVVFYFQIMNEAGNCTLFEESRGKDMSNSGGVFDIPIGEGTMSWPDAAHGGLGFYVTSAFSNNRSYICKENAGGAAFTPSADEGRILRVRFNDGSGIKTISPDNIIRTVPFAAEASNAAKLGGVLATNYLTVSSLPNCVAGTFLTYDKVNNIFSCTAVDSINGSDVVGNISGSAAGFSGLLSGDVSGHQATTSVDKIKGIPVSATAPTAGQVLQFNSGSWVPTDIAGGTLSAVTAQAPLLSSGGATPEISLPAADSSTDGYLTATDWDTFNKKVSRSGLANCNAQQTLSYNSVTDTSSCLTIDDTSKLPLAGGTLTGDLSLGTHNLLATGHITMKQYSTLNLGTYDNTTEGALVGTLGAVDAGKIWFNSETSQMKYWDGGATRILGISGSGLTSFNGSLQNYQTLGAVDLGTSVLAPEWSTNTGTGVHTLKIPMASDTDVTAGLLSRADYDTFNAKLDASALTNATVENFSGNLVGDVTGTQGATLVEGIQGQSVTLSSLSSGQVLQYNGSGFVNATLTDSDSFASLPCGDGFVPYRSAGVWGCKEASSTGSQANSLVQLDGSNVASAAGFNVTAGGASVVLAPPAAGVYSLTLPTSAGSNGQVLTSSGASGILSWSTPSSEDATKLPLAGGTMTGDIDMDGHLITGIANVPFVAAAPTGTETGKALRWDGTVWEWFDPATSGSSGMTSLNGSTEASQSFAAIDLGTSVTAPEWSSNTGTGVHTLKIPMAADTGVTAGLLSRTDYDTFNAKLGASDLTNATVKNFSGSLTGDVTGTQGATVVEAIQGKSVTLSSLSSGQVLQYNGSGFVNATLTDSDSFASLPCGDGFVPYRSAGVWGCKEVSSTGAADQVLALDSSSIATMSGLKLTKGAYSATLTAATTPSASYTLRLPAAAPGANQIMQSDASGNLSWTAAGSPEAWVNGGNNFGGTTKIGNTNGADLSIITTNLPRITVKAGGNVGVGEPSPDDTLQVKGTIRSASVSNTTTSIDWSKGNTQYVNQGCTGSAYTFSNMRDGGVYTLAITGTFSAPCRFGQTSPDTLSATAGSGNFYFLPANSTPSGANSVYSFMRVGNSVYVTWNSGFAN